MTTHRGTCRLAAIWCNDAEFREWLASLVDVDPKTVTPEHAAECIRVTCEIESRRELDTDQAAAERFMRHVRDPFRDWRDQRRNQQRRAA